MTYVPLNNYITLCLIDSLMGTYLNKFNFVKNVMWQYFIRKYVI